MKEPRGALTGEAPGAAPDDLAGADAPDAGARPAAAPEHGGRHALPGEPADEPTDEPTSEPTEGPTDEPTDGPAEESSGEPAEPAAAAKGPGEPPLDASAHAHLLEAPLPPDATTETALIYNVTLAQPHGRPAEGLAPGPSGAAPPSAPTRISALPAPPPPADLALSAQAARSAPAPQAEAAVGPRGATGSTRWRTAARVALAALLACLLGLSAYLWVSAVEWRGQARGYLSTSRQLGDDLASTRNQLAGSQAELEAVRAQLSTAHERIVALADEKNQALDDWEITQQLVDYQQRVSEAAGGVALALDRCVQGQQELIGYLQQQAEDPDAPPYDPAQLTQFETDVELLCQEASEANISLQLELSR